MKNLWMLLLAAVLLVTGNALAFTPPSPTGYVTDTSGKLSPAQVAQLNQRLTNYQRQTKNEVAVVMVPSLGGENLSDVTHQVFKAYGIGKAGLDNGVLLFIAVNDHQMRLQTGKGVEGEIPDITAKDILGSMRPYLKAGDFNGGISKALDGIQGHLDNRFAEKADPGQGQQFNKPVTQEDNTVNGAAIGANTNPNANKNAGTCSVGAVGADDGGNFWGWTFGLLAAFVGAILFARRYIRQREEENMRKLEAEVEAQMKAEEEENQRRAAEALAAQQAAEEKARMVVTSSLRANLQPIVPQAHTAPSYWGGALPPVASTQKTIPSVQPKIVVPAPIPVPVIDNSAAERAAAEKRHLDEQLAQARREREAEERRAEARRAREAEEREEERRAQARRERLEEEAREERRRQREAEEAEAAAAAVVVTAVSSLFDDDSSSDSGTSSNWGSDDSNDSDSGYSGGSDDSDSGFGGGDSGGGGSDDSW